MACELNEFNYVNEYVNALDAGHSHPCNGEEGRHVLEVINAIYWSAIQGTRVSLADMPRHHPLTQFRLDHGLKAEPDPAPRPYKEWLAAEDRRLGR